MAERARDVEPAGRAAGAPRPSAWAILSLFSAIALCPPFTLLAVVLGIAGVRETKRPGVTGRRYAIVGIAIGAALSTGWLALGAWWHFNGFRPMVEGPRAALVRGFAGDLSGFRERFCERGASASDEEVATFLDELRRRYGDFLTTRQDEERARDQAIDDPSRPRLCYVFEFSRETVEGDAVFVRWRPSSRRPVLRFASMTVRDTARGDLTYPVP